jgi:hypothetical protein
MKMARNHESTVIALALLLCSMLLTVDAFAPMIGRFPGIRSRGSSRQICTGPGIMKMNTASSGEPAWDNENADNKDILDQNVLASASVNEQQPSTVQDSSVMTRLQNLVEDARQRAQTQSSQAERYTFILRLLPSSHVFSALIAGPVCGIDLTCTAAVRPEPLRGKKTSLGACKR